MTVLWIVGIVIVVLAGIVAFLVSQYNHFRKMMPTTVV